ncbi:MAG: FecR domain-containing protein, partial [Rhodospirillales bacterium]
MATKDFGGSEQGSVFVIETDDSGRVVLPEGLIPSKADFVRSGPDLVLEFGDGSAVTIRDYFTLENAPDILSTTGVKIEGALATRLAGPVAPGQVAQPAGTDAAEQPIGRVETAEGEVYAIRLDGTQVELKVGDPIYQGDQLETGADGTVGVVFIDDTTFSLGHDGTMVLDEMIYDPNTESGSSTFSLVQGVFSFVSGKISKTGVDAMQVKTPVATIGIRGTKGGIDLSDGETLTVVLTQEDDGQVGEIAVYNDAGVQILNQPFQATQVSGFNVAPGQSFTVSAQQFEQTFAPALRSLPQTTFGGNLNQNEDDNSTNNQDGPNQQGEEEDAQNDENEGEPTEEAGPDAPVDEAGPPLPDEALQGELEGEGEGEGDEELELEEAAGPPVLEGQPQGEGDDGAFGPDLGGAPEDGDIDVVTGGDYTGNQGSVVNFGGVDVGGVGSSGPTGGVVGDQNDLAALQGEVAELQTLFGPISGQNTPHSYGETVFGGAGSDTLDGGGGNDVVLGGGGNDIVGGGTGNDVLTGDAGNDHVAGGSGGDTIIGGTGLGDDVYDGGDGEDWVFYMSADTSITIDLSSSNERGHGFAYGDADQIGFDTLISIEHIIGGAGSDTITGNADGNYLDGYSGDDTIDGGAGDDTFVDRGGDDSYFGGAGNDTLLVGIAATAAEPKINAAGTGVTAETFALGAAAGSNDFTGGTGTDILSFELHTSGVTIQLDGRASDDVLATVGNSD